MRFDPDCVRDILFAAEERTDGGIELEWFIGNDTVDGLEPYPANVAKYHIRQCVVNGLLTIGPEFIDGSFVILDLTPKGHQTLAQLRKPKAIQAMQKAKEAGLIPSVGDLLSLAAGFAVPH